MTVLRVFLVLAPRVHNQKQTILAHNRHFRIQFPLSWIAQRYYFLHHAECFLSILTSCVWQVIKAVRKKKKKKILQKKSNKINTLTVIWKNYSVDKEKSGAFFSMSVFSLPMSLRFFSILSCFFLCPTSPVTYSMEDTATDRERHGGRETDGDKVTKYSSPRLSEQGVNRQGQLPGSEFSMRVDLRRLPPRGLRALSTLGPFWAPPGAPRAPPNF